MSQETKLNYFIYVGTVKGEIDGKYLEESFNGIVTKKEGTNLQRKDLGQMQQTVQLRMEEVLGENFSKFKARDVVISDIYFLGSMSKEEFNEEFKS